MFTQCLFQSRAPSLTWFFFCCHSTGKINAQKYILLPFNFLDNYLQFCRLAILSAATSVIYRYGKIFQVEAFSFLKESWEIMAAMKSIFATGVKSYMERRQRTNLHFEDSWISARLTLYSTLNPESQNPKITYNEFLIKSLTIPWANRDCLFEISSLDY